MSNGAILRGMSRLPIFALLSVLSFPLAAEPSAGADSGPWTIDAIDWARPRHGEWLLKEPALVAAVASLERRGGVLEVRYPGGDSGSLWAGELRAWLVSLGVGSSRIQLRPGAASAEQIELYHLTATPPRSNSAPSLP